MDPTNTVYSFLAQYQARYRTDVHTAKDLAKKIVLANEAGYFAPAEAFIVAKDEEFSPYAHCEDAPKKQGVFLGLNFGLFFNKEPQQIIDELIVMPKDTLKEQHHIISNAVEIWNQQVKTYLSKVEEANKMREL